MRPTRLLVASLALSMLAALAVSGFALAAPAARGAGVSAEPPTITAMAPGTESNVPGQLTLTVRGERFAPGEQMRVVLCAPTPTGPGDPGDAIPPACAPEVGTLLGTATVDASGAFAFTARVAAGEVDQRAAVEVLRAGEMAAPASRVALVNLPGSARPSWGDTAGLMAVYFGLPLLVAALIAWGIIRGMRRPRPAGQAAIGNGDAQPAG